MYDLLQDVPLTVFLEGSEIKLLQVDLDEYWHGREFEAGTEISALEVELERKFLQAVNLTAAALGPPEFQGYRGAAGYPDDLRVAGDWVAFWELDSGVFSVQANDSKGDTGPWMVQIDLEPYIDD